jgi:hypothetical protein
MSAPSLGKPRASNWLASMAKRLLIAGPLLAASTYGALADDNLATAQITVTSEIPEPAYLQRATDPAFGTPFTRVTDPGQETLTRMSCGQAYCTHRYSSSQAWNADQSLLVIANGCTGLCFLDGRSYEPLFERPAPGECEWHPTDPALMLCVVANEIYAWAPQADARTTLYAPADYRNLQFGPYKGNPSKDGSRLVVRATNSAGALVAFAYDVSARLKYPDINLAELDGGNSFCSISPSGRYIFCFQELSDETNGAYVFTVDGVQFQALDGESPAWPR